jgi:hypothetical protein
VLDKRRARARCASDHAELPVAVTGDGAHGASGAVVGHQTVGSRVHAR